MTGIEIKAAWMVVKTLFLPAIALFFVPIYDWIVLQFVQDYSFLTPIEKAIITDVKNILGLLVMAFTLFKLVLGSIKIKKELEQKKDNTPSA